MENVGLEGRHRIARGLATTYGIVAYAGFLAVFASMIGFIEGLDVPRGIDGAPGAPAPVAVAVDLALLALFAGQHSVMARARFKRWWTRFVPQAIERSTYVLASSVVLALLIWQWRSMTATVWEVGDHPWRVAIVAASFGGWALVLVSTFLVDHVDMFGLRQVVRHQRGLPQTNPPFQTRLLYRVVRHPLLLGVLVGVWAAPTMSVGHLLFAGAITGYVLVGVRLEERDLVANFGERYRRYRREVPMLVPGMRRRCELESATRAGVEQHRGQTVGDGRQASPRRPQRGRVPGARWIECGALDLEGTSTSAADAPTRGAWSIRLADGAPIIVRELLPSDEES
ncbi:MAG TPA: NnrU family protein, partial [Actinomycetota bacterium]